MKNIAVRAALGIVAVVLMLQLSTFDLKAQVGSGAIAGTARDSSGAIIPKANISCKSVETGAVRNVTTDNLGNYSIPGLPVGTYEL